MYGGVCVYMYNYWEFAGLFDDCMAISVCNHVDGEGIFSFFFDALNLH